MAQVAAKLADQFLPSEGKLIGVGDSGGRFAQFIDPNCYAVTVKTTEYNRDRTKRKLEVGPLYTPNFRESAAFPFDIMPSWQTGKATYGAGTRPGDFNSNWVMPDRNFVLCDDVAVSGETLRRVIEEARNPIYTALVGMMYASSKARKRIGIDDIRSAVVYANEDGRKTPMNSLDALRGNKSGVLDSLADRYFNDSEEFKTLIREGE